MLDDYDVDEDDKDEVDEDDEEDEVDDDNHNKDCCLSQSLFPFACTMHARGICPVPPYRDAVLRAEVKGREIHQPLRLRPSNQSTISSILCTMWTSCPTSSLSM